MNIFTNCQEGNELTSKLILYHLVFLYSCPEGELHHSKQAHKANSITSLSIFGAHLTKLSSGYFNLC